jgi:hypothetical protein
MFDGEKKDILSIHGKRLFLAVLQASLGLAHKKTLGGI